MLLPCTCEISSATPALWGLSRTERLRGGLVTYRFILQPNDPPSSITAGDRHEEAFHSSKSAWSRAGTCSGDLCTDRALKNTAERENKAAATGAGATERAAEGFDEIAIKETKHPEQFSHRVVFVLLLSSCCTPCSEHLWVQSSNPEALIWINQCSII